MRVAVTLGAACWAIASSLAGCVEGARRAQGGSCSADKPCADGVCHDGRCLDADGDEDNDGLSNADELRLGLNPFSRDSDGDGADDLAEIGDDLAKPRDEDGDGIIDALESSGADSDGDCVNDQRDPDALGPPAGTIEAVCSGLGLCADEANALRVTCRLDELGTPIFTCDYSGIAGHAAADQRCDGVDEDCDGATDEDYVTNATFCDESACSATGVRTCVDGAEVDSCDRPVTEDDTTCDGVDDDCDGATDDDFVPTETGCGLGPCAATGQLLCVEGEPVDTCAPRPAAASDANCDGVDDDCDGEADDDYASSATSCGVGACQRSGTTRCEAGVESDDCTPGEAAAADATCDDVDDDCDGEVDEDYTVVATTCGEGPCAGSGVLACVQGEEQDSCESDVGAEQDADCDGVDDDCDGETDEDYEARATTCGTGACARSGVTSCAGGEERDSCQPGAPQAASDSTCDGVDDDCDGATDESYVARSTACGTGACSATGTTRCEAGVEKNGCTVKPPPSTNDPTCDGVDDNCDGMTDEDFVGGVTTCGRGACAATGTRICSIQGEIVDTCTPGAPLSGSDTTCDGVDDDCNGVADEDFAVTTTTCGTGACSTEGQRTCQGGEIVDTCVAGTEAPSDADCDGVDDDCNGATDEDYVQVAVTCGTGACVASGTRVCSGGSEQDICTPLTPSCGGRECGSDGCGGSCGTCTAPVGAACVSATCNLQQRCELGVISGCFVGGVCYAPGAANPGNACQVCNPASPLGWSFAAAGSSCADDGDPCTADRCDGAGSCEHVAKTDFEGCDDGSAATQGDVCIASVCTGFIEVLEPRFGIGAERFVSGGQGTHRWGAGGLTAVGSALWVTRYGAAEQAISAGLGTAGAHFALDQRYVINGNVLWEYVGGGWSSTPAAGSIRAAFPVELDGDESVSFYWLREGAPGLSTFIRLAGLGITGDGRAVHRSCLSPAGSDGRATTWTCTALGSAMNDYGAGLAYVGGITTMGSNVGSRETPSQIRIRQYDADANSWTTLSTLQASGRRLTDFIEIARLSGFDATTMAIGVGTGGLFFVTDLTSLWEISLGAEPPIDWRRAVSFQGRMLVLGHRTDSSGTATVLASAPLDRVTSPSDWTLTTVLPAAQGRRAETLIADSEHLYLLGARSVSGAAEQSAMWRLRPAPSPEEIWEETFSGGVVPADWTVHANCASEGSASWSVADGVLQLFGNCIDAPASTQDIRRVGTFITTGDIFGEGTLQVAFFAFDNDAFGVVYNVQDDDNYYRLSLDAQSNHMRLVKVVDGVFTLLAEEAPRAPELMAWQRIEVRRSAATHTIRVDGRTLFSLTDGSLTGGTFGVYGWAMNDVRFDDLRLFPL